MDEERIVARAALRGAVCAQIVCPKSRLVLDVRTSVLTEIKWRSGNTSQVVVHQSVWANMEAQLPSLRAHSMVQEVNVYDGRILFG